MAEILPNGKTQEYTGICPECKQETSVNMQGTPINHEYEVKNLRIRVSSCLLNNPLTLMRDINFKNTSDGI